MHPLRDGGRSTQPLRGKQGVDLAFRWHGACCVAPASMTELPILAFGFAGTFKVRELPACFPGAALRLTKNHLVATYAADRLAVAFDFGALVCVNMAPAERAEVLARLLAATDHAEPHAPLEEDFVLEVRADAPASGEVRFDRVVVPALGHDVVELITRLLAQSVAIDYYEEDLEAILADLGSRAQELARRGRNLGSSRQLARFVGQTIATRNQIIAALAVLDKPAATWESEALDRLYRDLRTMLEIDERFRALEYKLHTIQDTLALFLELAQQRRSTFLELTVVVLIVVELGLSLLARVG